MADAASYDEAARDGQTALALRLAKLLAPADDAAAATCSGNVAFSPVSVHAALALVAAGARGATLTQLLAFLGAPSAADVAAFGRRVADRVLADRADAGGPRVLFGGGVWVNSEHGKLRKAFKDVAAKSYKSETRTVSFANKPEEAVTMINKWVKKATGNLIDSIVSRGDITAATDLVLASAVYFKGAWLEPFDSSCTSRGTFHRLDGSRVDAEFMQKLDFLFVSCMDGFRVLKLPYKRGHAQAGAGQSAPWWRRDGQSAAAKTSTDGDDTENSMLIFLPDKPGGIATMVDMITAAPGHLYSFLPKAKAQHVIILLPKFEISFNWDLDDDLRRLGLSLPFSPEVADLRGMYEKDDDGRPSTFLSKVVHKAVVKVNEAGTEAAAVTGAVRIGGTPRDMVDFIADHPFTFLIMEERSGVIVFAGHVLDPTK